MRETVSPPATSFLLTTISLLRMGRFFSESELFKQQAAIADIDLERLQAERVKTTSFGNGQLEGYRYIFLSR
jgi:hypothetical protein